MKRLMIPVLALMAAGCGEFGSAMTAHTGVVARVGEHELTVDEMVGLLAGNPRIPAQTEVVSSVADLWVDYMILGRLLAQDSTLASMDLTGMIEPYVEQRTFMELREQVMTQDTVIGDDELQRFFEERSPGLRVRARHVLLTYPDDASEAQRDSVRALAEDLRRQAEEGADFEALAREHSDEPGAAQRGGDLGWFERDQMVKPFEDAAFALQPGEISPVVETPFGLHVIKVEERESPSFEEMGPDFRQQAIAQRQQESLDEYVSGLTGPADLEVESGAADVVRDIARRPTTRLRGRAASRKLVTWEGGELTTAEFLRIIRRMPPQQRASFAAMRDEQMSQVLEDLATNELVLQDAVARGIEVPTAERDSVSTLLREQISQVARTAGLIGPTEGEETTGQAVERRVRTLLESILAGRANLLPLGALPFALRQDADWQIHERAFPAVVDELEERRAESQGQTPTPTFPMPSQPGQGQGGQAPVQPPPQPQPQPPAGDSGG